MHNNIHEHYKMFLYTCFVVTDFRERNATVARKWAELTEDERKAWAAKAEAVCASSMQVVNTAQYFFVLLHWWNGP